MWYLTISLENKMNDQLACASNYQTSTAFFQEGGGGTNGHTSDEIDKMKIFKISFKSQKRYVLQYFKKSNSSIKDIFTKR